MKTMDCGTARERIPEFVHGLLAGDEAARLDAHLRACAPCREELALVRLLYGSRSAASDGLEERVLRAVAFERQVVHRPWWAVTAAAVAALALGIGLTAGGDVSVTAPAYAMEAEEGWPWVLDEGLVAGSPVLEDLSDDDLEALLADLAMVDGGD